MNSRIIPLDETAINRIAAGEVVERPASVVKELVENSLDAGAARITIRIEEGGKKLIQVTDNGCGMNATEAALALQRHATSKIRTADDLFHIATLGFRGEGLPSIASVSILELITKTPESETGYRILVHGGDIVEQGDVGCADGTSISVSELFFKTPARLKFMKSYATETSHILELISKYSMIYPNVSFRLYQGDQCMMTTPGNGDIIGALTAVWGKDVAKNLAVINHSAYSVQVRGFISPPHITRPTRTLQYFSVNKRPVRARILYSALDEAYRSLTPEKRFPIVFLDVEVEPSRLDVNVHPTKIEVRFAREQDVFSAVNTAVRTALQQHGMMPSALDAEPFAVSPFSNHDAIQPSAVQSAIEAFFPQDPSATLLPPSDIFSAAAQTSSSALPFADLLPGLKVLGQMRLSYIVCETAKGLVLIDQHVAHERVLYEQICGIKGKTPIDIQGLLNPAPVAVDKRALPLIKAKMAEFARLGFELELFGEDSFLLRTVPATLADKDYISVFKDMVDELTATTIVRKLPAANENIWAAVACKQAVKAGDSLTFEEMELLIKQLAITENPYLCPHGRPIAITLTNDELDRKFRRI